MENDLRDQTRSAATLAVLGVLFVVALAWGWSRVTEPFPERAEAAPCTVTPVAEGEELIPSQVMVTVLNAGGRNGLAGATMRTLVKRGFVEGSTGNAPADVGTVGAQIWAADPGNPAAILLASYLGDDVDIVDRGSGYPGITVVVGERFKKVTRGRESVVSQVAATVCMPPVGTVPDDVAEPTPSDEGAGADEATRQG